MRVTGALPRTPRYFGTDDGIWSSVPGAALAASQIRWGRAMAIQPTKGRGARSNASGRYEATTTEDFDDGWTADDATPAPLRTTLTPERARMFAYPRTACAMSGQTAWWELRNQFK